MPDLVDRATERADEILADALYEHGRRAGIGGRVYDDSRFECADCGEPIPEERRAIFFGVQRCVPCQRKVEEQEKMRSGR